MTEEQQGSRYKTTHRHAIWRGLAIFKVGASPYWRARFYDRQAKRYVTISTKETLKWEAIIAAEIMVRAGKLNAPIPQVNLDLRYERTFECFASRALKAVDVAPNFYPA